MLVRPIFDAYDLHLRDKLGHADMTVVAYRLDLELLCRHLCLRLEREPMLADLTKANLQGWLSSLRREGKSASTVQRRRCAVRSLIEYLRYEEIPTDPSAHRLLCAKRPKPFVQFLTKPEVDALLAGPTGWLEAHAAAPLWQRVLVLRDLAMLCLDYESGIRCTEICLLKLANLRWDCPGKGDLLLRVFGKGEEGRFVVFKKRTQEVLKAYLAARKDWAPKWSVDLFVSHKTRRRLTRSGYWRIVKRWGKVAGLECHPHLLRHTCATHLRHNGVELEKIQALLGHKQLATTQIYAHASRDELFEVADRHPLNCTEEDLRTPGDLLKEVLAGQQAMLAGQQAVELRLLRLEAGHVRG